MISQGRNLLIGAFVIAAIAVAVGALLFINPSMGDNGQTIRVRFHNIDKINVGTRVLFAGKPVGSVYRIEEMDKAREQAETCEGPIYIFLVTLKIDSHVKVYTSDDFDIRTSGLLGERSVVIIPRKPRPGQPYKLIDKNMVIIASPSKSFEDILSSLDRQKFWDNMAASAKNVKEITHALNNQKALTETVINIQGLSESLKRFADKVNDKVPTIENMIDDLGMMSNTFKKMSEKIARGEGTIGKLVYDDSVYLQANSIMTKAEILMNDVNHYGLLFHLDRKWQRQRTLRLNHMLELQGAGEFRNYFEAEMDQMNTSLARVSMLIQDAQECNSQCNLMMNRNYRRAFADLLRRVKDMEEQLKAYNSMINNPEDCNIPCIPMNGTTMTGPPIYYGPPANPCSNGCSEVINSCKLGDCPQ